MSIIRNHSVDFNQSCVVITFRRHTHANDSPEHIGTVGIFWRYFGDILDALTHSGEPKYQNYWLKQAYGIVSSDQGVDYDISLFSRLFHT